MKLSIAGCDPEAWDVVSGEGGDRVSMSYQQMISRPLGDSDPVGGMMCAQDEEDTEEEAPKPKRKGKKARKVRYLVA